MTSSKPCRHRAFADRLPARGSLLTDVSRRDLLGGAFSLAALLGIGGKALAQSKRERIDVHHHLTAPVWLEAVQRLKKDNPPMAKWSVEKSLEDMEKGGVATAILSPTTPQLTGLDSDMASHVARESNEYSKRLETDHPGRFGTFAMLPLPNIDASLKEIAYAFDTLKVDGVGCMTSYGDKWLGYAEFEPIWEELDRRGATVYTHPTGADCCVNLVRGIADAYLEYGTDTTRSIFSLIFSGTAQRYKNINWIWSHGGGALTAFADRFLVQALGRPPYQGKFTRDDVEGQLQRFYYDTAQIPNNVTLSALVQLVPVSQIVYGTDYPYRTAIEHTKGLTAFFKSGDLDRVDRENALRLFPRFRSI